MLDLAPLGIKRHRQHPWLQGVGQFAIIFLNIFLRSISAEMLHPAGACSISLFDLKVYEYFLPFSLTIYFLPNTFLSLSLSLFFISFIYLLYHLLNLLSSLSFFGLLHIFHQYKYLHVKEPMWMLHAQMKYYVTSCE